MKRLYLFFILLLLVPCFVHAKEDVYIKAVDVDEIYGDVVQKDKPVINGMNIDLNLKFSTVSSYIRYKVTIQNDSKEDYQINKKKAESVSYFLYSYSYDGEDIVKPGKSKDLIVEIKFDKKIPRDKFKDGKYEEDALLSISFSSNNEEVNPNTKVGISILVVVLLLLALTVIIIAKRNRIVLVMLLLVPVMVFALKEIKITIKAKIEVDKLCDYKLVTNMESFSRNGEQEICVDMDEEYVFSYNNSKGGITPDYAAFREAPYLMIEVDRAYFHKDGYLRVHNRLTNEVILEITEKDLSKYRYSVQQREDYDEYYSKKVDKSDGYYIDGEGVEAYKVYAFNEKDDHFIEANGPWISEEEDYEKVNYLRTKIDEIDVNDKCGPLPENADAFIGYTFEGFTNCRIYEKGKENICGGNIYYAKINFTCDTVAWK